MVTLYKVVVQIKCVCVLGRVRLFATPKNELNDIYIYISSYIYIYKLDQSA